MRTPDIAALALVLTAGLAGCATTPDTDPARVEQDFGNSVREMIDAQTYDREAARKPPAEPPQGLDGVQGEAVLKSHREHVGDPDSIEEDVRIRVAP